MHKPKRLRGKVNNMHSTVDFLNLPNFEKSNGLISAIVQDNTSKEVLMSAFMNKEAWEKTLESGYAHYYSRSRKAQWKKGESSGHLQKIISIRIDCDNDCVLLLVDQIGPACHTNHISCFYNELTDPSKKSGQLLECSPIFEK